MDDVAPLVTVRKALAIRAVLWGLAAALAAVSAFCAVMVSDERALTAVPVVLTAGAAWMAWVTERERLVLTPEGIHEHDVFCAPLRRRTRFTPWALVREVRVSLLFPATARSRAVWAVRFGRSDGEDGAVFDRSAFDDATWARLGALLAERGIPVIAPAGGESRG